MFMLQQRLDMNLYSFNKVSWRTGYDNKAFNFCVNLLVTDVVISILLAFVCVFISLNGGMRV